MRVDLDSYREIIETLTRNKSRSFLTGFGVFWGVFMLVALIGGGKGLKEMLNSNFEGFATNSAMIWSQQTTKPFKGFRKGRWWSMDNNDIERLRRSLPELDVVAPVLFSSSWGSSSSQAYHNDQKSTVNVQGVSPEYAQINTPQLYYGRYINDMDIQQKRKVCVIGKKVYKELFKEGGDPCGKSIRVDSTYFQIVGVDYSSSNISINGRADEQVTLPISLVRQAYNRGNVVDIIAVTGRKGVVMSSISPRIRTIIARAHTIDPTDERAVMVFNTEVLFQLLDNLFKGVNFLIWLVGLGTLLAGAIGVSNIMMVTVKERTTEIGIRRAIGAKPQNILSQIISESIVLTLVAGMSGILFAVLILQMLEVGNTEDGIVTAHFQVDFWTAVGAALLISVMGVLAGLAPAARALAIKPVDAMRDE
jgi:putative ABC transport system permease protein